MMQTIFLAVLLLPAILAAPCNKTSCVAPNCQCTSGVSPISTATSPQFVLLSFDDAIIGQIYDDVYYPLLHGRLNPDNNTISASFFVPHEYTNYSGVNAIYNAGHDIGSNSITKNFTAEYWTTATAATLTQEFGGQKQIINTFANVPNADIRGARTPQFLINGDTTFSAYVNSTLQYDNSWPTPSTTKLFPYTLDYDSGQNYCIAKCPTASFPGFWVVPINNLVGNNSIQCNVLFGCLMDGTVVQIRDWLIAEFNKTYLADKTPFNLLINSVWLGNPNNYDALIAFLDYIKPLKDVFTVSEWEAIKWMQKPVAYTAYKTTVLNRNATCPSYGSCPLQTTQGETRYMVSCAPCPAVYPWIGNPLGNATLLN